MAQNDARFGFDRWQKRNPSGTLEQYEEVLRKFNSQKKCVPLPKGRWLPGGVFVSTAGISPAEIGAMTKEFATQSFGQQ